VIARTETFARSPLVWSLPERGHGRPARRASSVPALTSS